jgi:hypothetical protein
VGILLILAKQLQSHLVTCNYNTMKKLLLLVFFSGSLDGFSQDKIDTLHIGGLRLMFKNDTLYNQVVPGIATSEILSIKYPEPKLDTLPSTILLTHKPPAFGHSIDGYCIYQGGACTGKHLRYWRKTWIRVGPEYMVWGCKRRAEK